MNKRRIIPFLSADLLCSSLAGCGSSDTSAKPPSEVQPSPSAEAVQPPESTVVPEAKEAIAEPADFSTLQNNDRILLMGPNDHRIVSIMKLNNALAAVASHLAEGSVVSLPDVSAILTYESGEDGAFSLRGPDGYLTTNANGQALLFGAKDDFSFWKAKEDGTLINVNAKPRSESDRDLDMGLLQFFNNTFTVMELRNDVMDIASVLSTDFLSVNCKVEVIPAGFVNSQIAQCEINIASLVAFLDCVFHEKPFIIILIIDSDGFSFA